MPIGEPQSVPEIFQGLLLKEQISLREGGVTKTVSKAEAVMRGLVVGALKGDARNLMTLMRIAEQTGEFEDEAANKPLTIRWVTTYEAPPASDGAVMSLAANRQVCSE